jgi:CPA1 family monovalent cation:H+ antiporter
MDPKTDGCEECLKEGTAWVNLRLCLTCGHVGCCNSSEGKHAQKHSEATGHPVIRAFSSGENWKYCYVDKQSFI